MVDPRLALIVFAGGMISVAMLAWPRIGLVARLTRTRRMTERVWIEDALKHVYTCDQLGRDCTLESLAGQLGVSTGRAAGLLARLGELEWVRSEERGPVLTELGRSSALRLVRAHRLWEQYLADHSGLPAAEWHEEAEHMEHALTARDTEALAARLGHPTRDPHGDPIPSPEGTFPSVERMSLAGVSPAAVVEVIHLEDEPHEVYDTLLGQGLEPGSRLEVIERSPRLVLVRSRGRTWPMTAVVARNVTVRLLPPGSDTGAPYRTLRDLLPGGEGVVTGLSATCRGAQRRRLLDLGVVKGTRIRAEFASAGGDPVAYRIRGALIALRGEQAEWIRIEPTAGEPAAGEVGAENGEVSVA